MVALLRLLRDAAPWSPRHNIGSRSFRYNLDHDACFKQRMDDQIIVVAMAQALQTDVARSRPILG
jgi:hypothetical protein